MKIAISVSEKERAKGAESAYLKALVAAGANPEEVELVTAADAARLRAEDYDGILFAGGEDVDPTFYGERRKYSNVEVNRPRDDFEFNWLNRALDRRLPILGICRGTQMINVRFGGTLYQDLSSDRELPIEHKQTGSRSEATHTVTLTDVASRLSSVFEGSCRVNSLHHQAINKRGRGLKVVAYSEDGLPEAVETAEDYPFLLGVQWHPEEMVDRPEHRKIFEQFLARCREKSAQRKAQERA